MQIIMDLNHNFKKTLDDINKRGWGFIESYTSEKNCDAIKNTLNYPKFPVNLNQPHPTFQGGTKFNNNVLTLSKEAFDVVTRNELIELAKSFVNDEVILKCIRSYSISKKYPSIKFGNLGSLHADGGVFLKANQKTGNVFIRSERGLGEGILITCQYDEDAKESNTFGPLPLDFFT